jgi:hypothetical protein
MMKRVGAIGIMFVGRKKINAGLILSEHEMLLDISF